MVIWRTSLKRDRYKVEAVLRRATALVPELKCLEYEDRLRKMNIPSMAYRQKRADMMEAWKFVHGKYKLKEQLLKRSVVQHGTRSGVLRLERPRAGRRREAFFTIRAAESWNELPDDVKLAPSLNAFKGRLDAHSYLRCSITGTGADAIHS